MRLGFHVSIAGGFERAVVAARRVGCEAVQLFSRNPRGWRAKPLSPDAAADFDAARRRAGLAPVAVHLPYLPNPAATGQTLYAKSVDALAEEITRTRLLGADYLVLHPGRTAAGEDVSAGLRRAARAVVQACDLADLSPAGPRILLETTAGRRGELGGSFEQLQKLRKRILDRRPNLPLGVCLDTAHVWAAGYDLASRQGLERTLSRFDEALGLDVLHLIHLNDSLTPRASRTDRHAAVGRGAIGARGLARVVRHPAFSHLAGIMETPRETEQDDRDNMDRAKRWRRKS